MLRHCLVLLVLWSVGEHAIAQPGTGSGRLREAYRNQRLAEQYSRRGDTQNATKHFLQIDPYYYISMDMTPQVADTFFSNEAYSKEGIEQYKQMFSEVYAQPRSETFVTLKRMRDEDQATRYKYSYCNDSITCDHFLQQMMRTDSVHFACLWAYIKEHGWPTLADGSMFAQLIALHDAEHWNDYLPILEKAMQKGDADTQTYRNIRNRLEQPTVADLLKKYKSKQEFNISCILEGNDISPALKERIIAAVRQHTPIKHLYFMYKGRSKKRFDEFGMNRKNDYYWFAWGVLVDVDRYERENFSVDHVDYTFHFEESTVAKDQLTVALIY